MDGNRLNEPPSIKNARFMDGNRKNEPPSINTPQFMDGKPPKEKNPGPGRSYWNSFRQRAGMSATGTTEILPPRGFKASERLKEEM